MDDLTPGPRALRRWTAVLLAVVLLAPVGADAQGAAPPAAPPADPFAFSTDAAFMLFVVKPAETENFELLWSVIRSRLAESAKPELRALGANLKIFKVGAPPTPPPTEVTYLFLADPSVKGTSYGVSPFLLYESGLFARAEADELFKLLETTLVRVSPFGLDVVK
jgi:hypothetical protein